MAEADAQIPAAYYSGETFEIVGPCRGAHTFDGQARPSGDALGSGMLFEDPYELMDAVEAFSDAGFAVTMVSQAHFRIRYFEMKAAA